MKQLNLNCIIKVKLTERGKFIYFHRYDDLNDYLLKIGKTPIPPRCPEIDENGFTKFQLWYFMEIYGEHMTLGSPEEVIQPLSIFIEEEDLDDWFK